MWLSVWFCTGSNLILNGLNVCKLFPADATALERGCADARQFNLDSHRTILTNVSRTIQDGDMLVSDEISFLEYDISIFLTGIAEPGAEEEGDNNLFAISSHKILTRI